MKFYITLLLALIVKTNLIHSSHTQHNHTNEISSRKFKLLENAVDEIYCTYLESIEKTLSIDTKLYPSTQNFIHRHK